MESDGAHADGRATLTSHAMRFRSLLPWLITLPLLGGLLALAYWVHAEIRKERETKGDQVETPKFTLGPGELRLPLKVAEAAAITWEAIKTADPWSEPVVAYGRVVPNPLATIEIRAAFAGTLRWVRADAPAPGQKVEAGKVLGWVDIRVGPQERLDLQNKCNEAQKKLEGARAACKIQQERVARYKAPSQGVSPRELEDAELQLIEAKTQEAVAKEAVDLWQSALDEIDKQGKGKTVVWSQPVKTTSASEVTELGGRSGMSVEAGGLLVRLVDFQQVLVRLDIPTEALAQGPPATVEISSAGSVPASLRGVRSQSEAVKPVRPRKGILVGPAPQIDVAAQRAGYFYRIDTGPTKENGKPDGALWRPGLFVQADLPILPAAGAEPTEAVSVPAQALLYHQGRPLVYVVKEQDKKTITFARREVQVLGYHFKEDRWVLARQEATLSDADRVVVSGAQVLLSEEFKGTGDND
jgi:hypothetical protein